MNICRVEIENFRNFRKLDIKLNESAVIVGENQIGKSNFLFALRILLDPSLSERARMLGLSDFWDGLGTITREHEIRITAEFTGFEDNEELVAILADYLVDPDPMTARITYVLRVREGLGGNPQKDGDFEYIIYGGEAEENQVSHSARRLIPLDLLHALRDAEGDLSNWSRSPLRPPLQRVQSEIDRTALEAISTEIEAASNKITELPELNQLIEKLNSKLKRLSGDAQAFQTSFGVAGTNPEKLLRALRIYIDGGQRDLSESSLGAANVLYLALRTLELEELANEAERLHTFFAIEEPEAHLHPHLQRTVYREYLAEKNEVKEPSEPISYFLTTHSPHIASVSPLNSLVLLRKESDGSSTGVSTAGLMMAAGDKSDIERYLDVSRAEALFAKGVILVEGDAEKFLIPILAKRAGYDLDALGITLCSISGTNFLPYVKFFGPRGLNMPLAVLTDFDPYSSDKSRGKSRVKEIVASEFNEDFRLADVEALKHEEHGLFLNTHTFEIDFYHSGYIHMMTAAMSELCPVNSAIDRFKGIAKQCDEAKSNVPLDDEARFLKDIEYVGKGRFAQRVAWHISQLPASYTECPEYIIKGINHVKAQIL